MPRFGSRRQQAAVVAASDEDEEARDKRPRAPLGSQQQRARYVAFVYGLAYVLVALSAHSVSRATVLDVTARGSSTTAMLLVAFNGIFWMLTALSVSYEYLGIVERSVDPVDAVLTSVNCAVIVTAFAHAFGVRNRPALALIGLTSLVHGVAQLALEHAVYYCDCLRAIDARHTPRSELLLPFAVMVATHVGPVVEVFSSRTGPVRARTVVVFAGLALVALLRFVVVFSWIFDGVPYSLVHLSSRATQAVRLAAFLYCFSLH